MAERGQIAIYIRVSTEDQAKEGYSLEVQREFLVAFVRREGFGRSENRDSAYYY